MRDLKKCLEPDNRFDIEVIGRLVHQGDLRVGRAAPAPSPPASSIRPTAPRHLHQSARRRTRDHGESLVSGSGRRSLPGVRSLPGRPRSARGCRPCLTRARRVGRVLELFELVMQVAELAAARDGFVEHPNGRYLFHILAEIPDCRLSRDRTSPLSGSPPRQSSGRASSCRTRLFGQARPFPLVQLERGVDEQELLPYCLLMPEERIHATAEIGRAGRPRGAALEVHELPWRAE